MTGRQIVITGHPAAKATLVALLAANGAHYAVNGTLGEAVDALAWFTLLVLFFAETTVGLQHRSRRVAAAIRGARLAAAVAIPVAGLAYLHAGAWLDASNMALWIAVVALLEIQVRRPALARRRQVLFQGAAVGLYATLAVVPLMWVAQREWFAAYDATLWLAAFATIEADVWPGRPARASA